jgi:hypothetical protein
LRNRKVKCRFCQIAELYPEKDMFVELAGKHGDTKKYWHYDCYEKELVRREKTKVETDEWDDLLNTIKEIHDIDVVPTDLITTLQDLRNGTERYREHKKIGYKQGVKYPIIKKAYEMSKKKIQWVKGNKKFKNTKGECKYCFMIVREKISDAKRELKRLQKIEDTYVNPHHSYSEFNVEPIVKKFPKS